MLNGLSGDSPSKVESQSQRETPVTRDTRYLSWSWVPLQSFVSDRTSASWVKRSPFIVSVLPGSSRGRTDPGVFEKSPWTRLFRA